MEITIRRFAESDAGPVSGLIAHTLRTTNAADYTEAYIDNIIRGLQPEAIAQRASWQHLYVAGANGHIVGCGAIGPFWGRADESSLFTIFVHPDYQKRGIGRRIIEALERDEYFLRARRIEVPASITAVPFYMKLGYRYKDGVTAPDEERLIRLEKLRG